MSQNMTYDDRNTVLKYSSGWFTGSYNATSVGQTGTLATSNIIGANVSFLFPVPATDFYYFGMKRSRGGRYTICIDCDPDNPEPITIEALDPTDNGQNPPVALFSQHFEVAGIHEVVLTNEADPSGNPTGNSQISLSSFVITVPDSNPPSTTSAAPSSVLSPVSTFSPPSTSAPPLPTSSSSSSASLLPGILGGVLGGLAVLCIIAGIWFFCWRRSRRQIYTVEQAGQPAAESNSQASRQDYPRSAMSAVSTAFVTTTASSSAPRRELDAGRIEDIADDTDTLPPEYGQVFNSRRESMPHPLSPLRPKHRSRR